MKNTLACSLVVLLAALGAGARAEKPAPYTSAVLGFTATYPLPVKEATNQSGGGTAAAVDPKGLMYMVGVVPEQGEDATKSAKERLDDGIAGAVAKVKGKIASQKDVKLGVYPGREVEVDVNDGHATMRTYLVGKKAYLLVVVNKNSVALPMSAADFFASFSLTKK